MCRSIASFRLLRIYATQTVRFDRPLRSDTCCGDRSVVTVTISNIVASVALTSAPCSLTVNL